MRKKSKAKYIALKKKKKLSHQRAEKKVSRKEILETFCDC